MIEMGISTVPAARVRLLQQEETNMAIAHIVAYWRYQARIINDPDIALGASMYADWLEFIMSNPEGLRT